MWGLECMLLSMDIELIVPYKVDCEERLRNKQDFLNHYQDHFFVNVIEDYNERSIAYNQAANKSDFEYIALADIDAIIPFDQMLASLSHLDEGAHMVYPYHHILNTHRDGTVTDDWPVGYYYGCMVLFNRKKFIEFGGENENFVGYGWEDLERYYRAINHGLIIERVRGNCYHMQHPRNMIQNPHFKNNYKLMMQEKDKCKNLTYSLDTTHQYLKMSSGLEN